MKKRGINLIILAALAGFAFFFPEISKALIIESGIPGQLETGLTTTIPIEQYITYMYNFMIGLVGIAGFASFVWYGIIWIYSGISEKKSEALEGIKNTLIGIGLALGAFAILNTINPELTKLKPPKTPGLATKRTTDAVQTMADTRSLPGYYFSYRTNTLATNGSFIGPFTSNVECINNRDAMKKVDAAGIYGACEPYNIRLIPWSFQYGKIETQGLLADLPTCEKASLTFAHIIEGCIQSGTTWSFKGIASLSPSQPFDSQVVCDTQRNSYVQQQIIPPYYATDCAQQRK